MKVSFAWIKKYVETNLTAAEVAERLTMAGIEVKSSTVIGGNWEGIMVGQMQDVKQHPNADRLHLVDIDLGGGRIETVVCGAPNCAVGAKVAYAQIGAKLTDPHTGKTETLKPAKIRGVVSSGMCCSEKELGISESHEGILILPGDAPLGTPLAEYLGDVIFNLEVTPNRPDCLSIIGLAREVAALTGAKLNLPDSSYPDTGKPVSQDITVEIIDSDLCPRYTCSLVTDIKIGESPEWMKKALVSCGMRPINNVVDITNFVMLEWGQPLHSFDYTKINGKGIVVRRAQRGEKITSLDGVERSLSRDMLVIADKQRAVAVAGIMGGANSEVSETTTSILLESASFNAASIHYTGRTLVMPSEACVRFERGISPDITVPALKRATQLLVELCGGKAEQGIVDVYPGKAERKSVKVPVSEFKRLLGIEFSNDVIVKSLESLGFEVVSHETQITAKPPYWRSDISLPADIVEEVVRMQGYDKIPTTLMAQPIPRQDASPSTVLKRRLRSLMTGLGFQDIISYSLIGMDSIVKISAQNKKPDRSPLRLFNAMTQENEYLRPSLRPNLLSAITINKAFIDDGLRLFELGKVYLNKEADLPEEPDMLCGVMAGKRAQRWWRGESENLDFYDAKGVVETLFGQLGIKAIFDVSEDESLHPARQAAIIIDGKQVGVVGEVHPAVAGHFEVPGAAFLFELNVKALMMHTGYKQYQPLTKFPATVRDIAIVVDVGVPNQKAIDIIKVVGLVTDVALFDVYAGNQVPAGKKSLAYRITYQSPTRTLTDDEVNNVQKAILKRLGNELGATLRT
jgi:phenylalanyl-tRNA synthetase beta chain